MRVNFRLRPKPQRTARLVGFSLLLLLLVTGVSAAAADNMQSPESSAEIWLDLQPVGFGLHQPVYVTDARDGSGRLFGVERGGRVRVIDGGKTLLTPYLDIASDVDGETGERGMFGLAFHPQFSENGYLYVTYSRRSGEWVLRRFTADPGANRVDPETGKDLLVIPYPGETHYAGMVSFGPDGYLYASIGDGGHFIDEENPAQDPGSLFGSIIRLDVDGGDPYLIPPDNPFAGNPEARPEIYLWGFRNPWRFSFDRLTGDLYIGDVGFESWEEINLLPAGSPAGLNFGWPVLEGPACSPFAAGCDPAAFVMPVASYSHEEGCSVSGGYVDRSNETSATYGRYLYGDFCDGSIWALSNAGESSWETELVADTDAWITSFGEDEHGNIYLTDFSGGFVYRIKASHTPPVTEIVGIDPDPLVAGTVGCHFILEGAGFSASAQVKINDQDMATRHIGSTRLLVTVPSVLLAVAGDLTISIANPGSNSDPASALFSLSDAGLADRAFQRVWERTDDPVATGAASRTWMWGPEGFVCAAWEPYDDAPGGKRIVQYFDKSRMEVTQPDADPNSGWYVTNGLLARELVTGELQLGDDRFEQRQPAEINLAGDFDAKNAPRYASFRDLLPAPAVEIGTLIVQRINHQGEVTLDQSLATYDAQASTYVPETSHTVAGPFWAFLNLQGPVIENSEMIDAPLFVNPFYATGFPITEAYWATVPIAGVPQDVLIQIFERRVLTYNPANPTGWQVESANTGLHYYLWRNDTIPPDRQF